MPGFSFDCAGVAPERYAAAPTMVFSLKIGEDSGTRVHSMSLHCQLRIEPQRRGYTPADAERLGDLFGEPSRWGETLKPMQFANVALTVRGFAGSTVVDMPVPCTYDFDVAAAKYLHALRDGHIPMLLLFSGTAFYQGETGMQVDQIPWDREVSVRVPVAVWRDMMDIAFPNQGWIRMRTDTLDALQLFKSRRALTTWDETLALLLRNAAEPPR